VSTTHVGHKTVVCSCGRVISTCRCWSAHKPIETRPHPACGHVEPLQPAAHVRRPECGLLGCLACEQRESELRARLEQLVRDVSAYAAISEDAARALVVSLVRGET
jgi:hypothetical protein